LESYLDMLAPAVEQAQEALGRKASEADIAKEAIKKNVFRTIKQLLDGSTPLRQKAAAGEVQLQGAIYDIESGAVDFLGEHPDVKSLGKMLGA